MPTDAKPPIVPTEAQRRRAALWWHLGSDEWPGSVYQWVKSGCVDDLLTHKQVLPQAAQLIATIESEAEERGRARGVEEAAKECDQYETGLRFRETADSPFSQETDMSTCAASLAARIRALLEKGRQT